MQPTRVMPQQVACLLVLACAASSIAEVSYRNDVTPILSKFGCNAGTCHGNFNGKGGFKLSLRGENSNLDFATMIRGEGNRRVNSFQPEKSLVLRKATAAMAHEGGKRFAKDSPSFRTLRDWIAQGLRNDTDTAPNLTMLDVQPRAAVLIEPNRSIQLRVKATFDDKTNRDVTSMAVYETSNFDAEVGEGGLVSAVAKEGETTILVRFLDQKVPVRVTIIPKRESFVWSNPTGKNLVDQHIFAKLKTLRMNPSALCSDQQFLRRVYLDLLGILPTASEAKEFTEEKAADKRQRLIDSLLLRPEFADVWAMKWSDLLRNEEKIIDAKGVELFHGWIRQCMAEGMPLDVFVRTLVTAKGSTYKEPASNFYRALREPNLRAEATAQLFLGTRLQCAKCHNHPFDHWTQDDYFGFAAFFAHVDYKIVENKRRDKNDKMMFIGEQIVLHTGKAQIKHPNTGRTMKPAFLDSAKPNLADKDQLKTLAQWLTSPENSLFAKAMANRIWQHMMGRGLVDPIDDFRGTNPPSHPKLLDQLAAYLVDQKFDLRKLIRLIANSNVYQLSSSPNESNASGDTNFARASVRRLTAEQLVDAISKAMGAPAKFNGYSQSLRAGQLPGVKKVFRDSKPSPGDRFLKLFGKPGRLTNCDCERSNDTALGQVFELVSGKLIDEALTAKGNRITTLLASKQSDEQIVTELYWSVLSRKPSKRVLEQTVANVKSAPDRRAALEDVAWGLFNAKEFLFRH